MNESIESVPQPLPERNDYLQRFKTVEQRFFDYIDKTSSPFGCWIWTGAKAGNYGALKTGTNRKMIKAHRLSWIIHNGPIPDGLLVLHDCPGGDNPACVNPAHLWLGTNRKNSEDMVNKGRQARGEMVNNAKLNEHDVIEVRKVYAAGGISKSALGRRFGISHTCIRAIVLRETWKHV